ncbi:MAG TPA: SprT family zinc-dependent metalloprotease [Rhodoferax sp.]|nr:SprT family zinc-dependent metalloprotease [Rhodoferax sp.]
MGQAVHFRHPHASREVRLGHALVAYEFKRGQRRSIGFSVGPHGLAVRAPKWVPLVAVDAALQEKSAWILRKLQEGRERHARLAQHTIDWRDGASLPFLGQAVTIKLDPAHGFAAAGAELVVADAVSADAAGAINNPPAMVLRLSLPHHASTDQIRDVVQAWLMRQAKRVFQERLDHFAPLLGVQWKKLALSNAGTRWGSARADGAIRLNWRLIHFRMAVLDYVVAHELSHLREMNHSPRFWDTVQSVVPDYAVLRRQLKEEAAPRWA